MATKKRRRAPNHDAATWSPEDRKAIQQSRVNAQSSRYQRETAIEKDAARARPQEPKQ